MTKASARVSAAERRLLSRQARDAFPPMGIYVVRDRISGHVWLGSSSNVHAALNRIQFQLRLGLHSDKAMQALWARDPAGFSFEILELLKERPEPTFDYQEELRTHLQLHREELGLTRFR